MIIHEIKQRPLENELQFFKLLVQFTLLKLQNLLFNKYKESFCNKDSIQPQKCNFQDKHSSYFFTQIHQKNRLPQESQDP